MARRHCVVQGEVGLKLDPYCYNIFPIAKPCVITRAHEYSRSITNWSIVTLCISRNIKYFSTRSNCYFIRATHNLASLRTQFKFKRARKRPSRLDILRRSIRSVPEKLVRNAGTVLSIHTFSIFTSHVTNLYNK